jgi:hypothetical protein
LIHQPAIPSTFGPRPIPANVAARKPPLIKIAKIGFKRQVLKKVGLGACPRQPSGYNAGIISRRRGGSGRYAISSAHSFRHSHAAQSRRRTGTLRVGKAHNSWQQKSFTYYLSVGRSQIDQVY